MGEFSFPMGENGNVSVDDDGVFSVDIEYSADIDEYTTISASISAKSDMSITAGYTITTNDGYDNIVSTSIELTHKVKKPDPPKPPKQPAVEPETVTIPETAPSTATDSASNQESDNGYGWDDFGQDALNVAKGAAVVAGVAITAYAVANDATLFGIIDDFFLIPLGSFLTLVGAH